MTYHSDQPFIPLSLSLHPSLISVNMTFSFGIHTSLAVKIDNRQLFWYKNCYNENISNEKE